MKPLLVVTVLFVQTIKKQIQDSCAQTESLALQTVKWIQVVRRFKAEKHEMRRYHEAVAQIQTLRTRKELYGYVYLFAKRVS